MAFLSNYLGQDFPVLAKISTHAGGPEVALLNLSRLEVDTVAKALPSSREAGIFTNYMLVLLRTFVERGFHHETRWGHVMSPADCVAFLSTHLTQDLPVLATISTHPGGAEGGLLNLSRREVETVANLLPSRRDASIFTTYMFGLWQKVLEKYNTAQLALALDKAGVTCARSLWDVDEENAKLLDSLVGDANLLAFTGWDRHERRWEGLAGGMTVWPRAHNGEVIDKAEKCVRWLTSLKSNIVSTLEPEEGSTGFGLLNLSQEKVEEVAHALPTTKHAHIFRSFMLSYWMSVIIDEHDGPGCLRHLCVHSPFDLWMMDEDNARAIAKSIPRGNLLAFLGYDGPLGDVACGPEEGYTETENGRKCRASTGDAVLDLFADLNRDLPKEKLQALVDKVLQSRNAEDWADLIVLMWQTRDVREGKGERSLFDEIFVMLHDKFPKLMWQTRDEQSMLDFLSHYGCYNDFKRIFLVVDSRLIEMDESEHYKQLCVMRDDKKFRKSVWAYGKQKFADEDAKQRFVHACALRRELTKVFWDAFQSSANGKPNLAGKWAPSEPKHKQDPWHEALRDYGLSCKSRKCPSERNKIFRQMKSKANKNLETTECFMSKGNFDKIDPGKVPGRCLNHNRYAFLNEVRAKRGTKRAYEDEQRSYDDRRERCRERFLEHKGAFKSKTVFPHELTGPMIKQIDRNGHCTSDAITEKMWQQMIKDQLDKIAAFEEAATVPGEPPAISPARQVFAIVDTSGSMDGTPMNVAIALGLLFNAVSDIKELITFHSDPTWFSVPEGTLAEKVTKVRNMPWGQSTDMTKAAELVANRCKTLVESGKWLPPDVANVTWMVLSDMQWNENHRHHRSHTRSYNYSSGYYNYGSLGYRAPTAEELAKSSRTQLEEIRKIFQNTRVKVPGSEVLVSLPVPKLVFWNLRGNVPGFPADANAPDVTLISGFSPNLLKMCMEGNIADAEKHLHEKKAAQPTPLESLTKLLNDERYDAVRSFLSENPAFAEDYKFLP